MKIAEVEYQNKYGGVVDIDYEKINLDGEKDKDNI